MSRSSTPTLSIYAPSRPPRPAPRVEFELWDSDQTVRGAAGAGVRDASGRVNWTVPSGVLTDLGEYVWRTRAIEGTITGPWSEFRYLGVDAVDGVGIPVAPPSPGAPDGVTAHPAHLGLYVTWQPAEPGPAANVAFYVVEAVSANGSGPVMAQAVVAGPQQYAVLTGLPADTDLVVHVAAVNDWHVGPAAVSAPARPVVLPQSPETFTRIATEYMFARGRILTGAATTPLDAAEASPDRDAIRDVVLADGPAVVNERADQNQAKLWFDSQSVTLSDIAVVPSADGGTVTLHGVVSENLNSRVQHNDGRFEQAVEERANIYTFTFAMPASGIAATTTSPRLTDVDTAEEAEVGGVVGQGGAVDDEGPPPEPLAMDGNGFVEGPPIVETRAVNTNAVAWYAWRFANSRNKNYKVKGGTDCTNFVSQALRYGGLKMRRGYYRSDSYWWYNGVWPTYGSFTWYAAHNNFNHMWKKKRSVFRRYFNQAVKGDILYFDFTRNGTIDHAAVINGVSGNHIWYAQHSRDTYNVHLNARLHSNPRWLVYIAHPVG